MIKEIVICIIVISLVISLNIFSEKYTNKVMDNIINNLTSIREAILLEDQTLMDEEIKKVKNEWDKYKDKLSLYIEHDDLEKIETYFVQLNTHIEIEEYNMAIEALDLCVFMIEHTKDKYKLSLKNIF